MSLHVNLSKEAEAQMKVEQRNSRIASIFISVSVIILIFLVLGYFLIPNIPKPTEGFIVRSVPKEDVTPMTPVKVNIPSRSKPSAPPSSAFQQRNIVALTTDSISIPVVDSVDISSDTLDLMGDGFYGNDGDFIGSIGVGDGEFKRIDGNLSKRCSQDDRMDRLKEMGGLVEAEATVERGLEWLKATQNVDGSWSNKHTAAMTGFGILAYLGRCETPNSTKYGDSCLRAITYLVDLGMKNDGKLSTKTSDKHWPYEHAIATYALCEAVTFCEQLKINIPNLVKVTEKSVNFIIENQHEKSGGWDYGYDKTGNRGGDLSIAAWHIQALKAASHTRLEISGLKAAQSKATKYVEALQGENGGFGYTGKPGGTGYAKLTGAGVLCLQMSGSKNNAAIRKGTKHILEFSKFDYDGKDSNLYAHYYESQAMMARGGSEWRKYNEMFRDQLINSQNPDGSWKIPGSRTGYTDPHYRTCLNILMLEVYYRFLPGTGKL